jgi:hypothetical protein
VGNPYAPPSGDRRDPEALPAGAEGRPGAGEPPASPGPQGWPPHHGPPQGPPPPSGYAQRPPSPHGSGQPVPQRPSRPDPDPAAVRATSRRVLHFGMLLLAAVLTTTLPLPWQAASLAFVIAALVVGIRAFVLAWRAGVRGVVLPMLGLGVASAGLVAVTVLSLLVVWPQQLERQECLAGAVTIAATERCEAEFRRSLEERLDPAGPRGDT